jgi:hypothetical protein
MQPLYYLPGLFRETLTKDDALLRPVLQARGLETVFADVRQGQFLCGNLERGSPDGQAGCLLAYHTAAGKLPQISGFYPEQQDWHFVEEGPYWIGLAKGQLPTPEDLKRPHQYAGYDIELAYGTWKIPVIRRVDDSTNLPRDCFFERGQLVEPIKDAYRRYWDASAEVGKWFFNEGGFKDFDKARGLILAIEALSLNYRYTLAEHALLRAVDVESLMTVLAGSVDYYRAQALENAKKKNASSSVKASTTPGPLAS